MNTIELEITPRFAEEFLKKNTSNRKIKIDKLNQFVREMTEGRWKKTHQGIAFYEDGTLADGQHRLKAIVLSNTPQTMLVTTNLPRNAISAIDLGTNRMAHDIAKILGYPDWVNKSAVAIARALLGELFRRNVTSSFDEIVAFIDRHSESIRFAVEQTIHKKRAVTHAHVAACYVCAYEAGEDPKKLARFAEIMKTGEAWGPSESAALKLREFLLFDGKAFSGPERVNTALRAQKALHAFCAGQQIIRLTIPSEFKYPVPK